MGKVSSIEIHWNVPSGDNPDEKFVGWKMNYGGQNYGRVMKVTDDIGDGDRTVFATISQDLLAAIDFLDRQTQTPHVQQVFPPQDVDA